MSGSCKGRIYPRKACDKCGAVYATNVIQRHVDQCSGEPLVEEAKKRRRTKPSVEFVWAGDVRHKALHAIDEQQVATEQDALCGEAPNGMWGRADELALGLDPNFPGHAIYKCVECVRLTQGALDITMRVNRAIDRQDGENDRLDRRDHKLAALRGPR
jgi:hypothetical protein